MFVSVMRPHQGGVCMWRQAVNPPLGHHALNGLRLTIHELSLLLGIVPQLGPQSLFQAWTQSSLGLGLTVVMRHHLLENFGVSERQAVEPWLTIPRVVQICGVEQ